jgi:hypothetical protein
MNEHSILSANCPMPIVRHAFKIDVLKMDQAFQMGYRQGENVLFVSRTNWQG